MRAMELRDDWGIDNIVLADRPEPEPGPGQVKVRMQAASLNYRDTVMAGRGYGRRSGTLPLVLVSDGAGEIVAVGAGVTRVAVGDLVCPTFCQGWISGTFTEDCWAGTLGGPNDGVMQDYMVLDEAGVVKAPSHLSPEEASTLPCAAVTAWNAVVAQGNVKAGDRVVIQGTGGVSLFALQFAALLGAETVLTSSSDEKLARAKALGATHLINYRNEPEWGRAAMTAFGGAADHVVEVGGAGTLEQSMRCIRPSGTISLIGVLSGGKGAINLGPVVTQNVRLQGITVGSRQMFEDMNKAMVQHQLRPALDDDRFAFEDLGPALQRFGQGRHFGKVVCRF